MVAAIVLGFFAMLRFHSYGKFRLQNLTIVLRGWKEVVPTTCRLKVLRELLRSPHVVGFYFTLDDKFHPRARAYFCKVADLNRHLRPVCPLRHLSTIIRISHNGFFSPPQEITRALLTQSMIDVACMQKSLKPHSLRIGGHTYYTVFGLNSNFRDYLLAVRWETPHKHTIERHPLW